MQKVYNLDIDGMTVNFPDKLKKLIEKKQEKSKMNNIIKPIIFNLDDVRRKAENGDKFACY